MPKILYLITQSEWGGAQKNAADLAAEFLSSNETLVAAGPDGDGAFFNELARRGIKSMMVKNLHRRVNPIKDIAAFFEIKSLIKKEKPDIIHIHSSKAGFIGSLAAGKKAKVIYTVHGAVFEAPFAAPQKKLFLRLEKFSAGFKDKIICVCQNDKNLWLKHKIAPSEKIEVIHNGINLQNIDFLPRDEARRRLFKQNINPETKIIGSIANFYPEKGLEFLVEAAWIISKNPAAKNIKFAIIGEGRMRPLLEEMIKQKNLAERFVLLGQKEKASRYLKAFDAFALPSIKEGLPYTILEAMAAQIPVVASKIGGVPEMIQNDHNGLLVKPRDPQELAQKILYLSANPDLAQKFIRNSQEKLKEFSFDQMFEKTKKVYFG
ncbi:MAG: Second mannosyl transferase [Parcubacteria group bacterium GW2011_GWB1_42_6]|nr:MAG: Second mannosyl transferase [Parcubacteria group bacterium GW2011_GWB1_42_6]